jgi:Na+/H+-translocating membrane pyrophosphatase
VHVATREAQVDVAAMLGFSAKPALRSVQPETAVAPVVVPLAVVVPVGQAVRPAAAVGPVVTALPAALKTAPGAEENPKQ